MSGTAAHRATVTAAHRATRTSFAPAFAAVFVAALRQRVRPTLRDGLRGAPLRHARLGAPAVGTAPVRFADTRLARAVVVALLAMVHRIPGSSC